MLVSRVIAQGTRMTLEKATLAELGKATAYRSRQRKTPSSSTVQLKPRNIEARVKAIRGQIEEATSDVRQRNCKSAWPSWPAVLP